MRRPWILSTFLILASCASTPGPSRPAPPAEPPVRVAEEREERPASLRSGLEIQSLPDGAEVFLDNRLVGTTPLLLRNLERGHYRLLLQKSGYYPQTTWIDFLGNPLYLRYELKRITGFIHVRARPPEAEILLDNLRIPNEGVAEVPAGAHNLWIRAFGCKERLERIEISESLTLTVETELEREELRLEDLQLSRSPFNPENPGVLGRTVISFRVTAPGTGSVEILDSSCARVFFHQLPPLKTWNQALEWNGRDLSGRLMQDGEYTVVVTVEPDPGVPGDPAPRELRRPLYLSRASRLQPRSLWSGSAGLSYAPSAVALPPWGFQASTLLFASLLAPEDDDFNALWSLSARLGLEAEMEASFTISLAIEQEQSPPSGGGALPLAAGVSLKKRFYGSGDGFSAAVGLRAFYQSFTADPFTAFTGLAAFLPLELPAGDTGIRFFLAPEIVLSPERVSTDPDDSHASGLYAFGYGRAGIGLELATLSLGLSGAMRLAPFQEGLDLDPPHRLGLEARWLLPESQLFLAAGLDLGLGGSQGTSLLAGLGLGLLH